MGANRGCKTKLLRSHVLDSFDDRYISTVGTKVTKKVLQTRTLESGSGVTLDFLIWDILSARGFRELLKEAYFHGSKGVVAVTDMTRRATLHDLDEWIEGVQRVAGRVPVVILAANRDRKEHLEMTEEEVTQTAKAHDAPCFFTSGSAEEGVEAAFQNLAETVIRRYLQPRTTAEDEER